MICVPLSCLLFFFFNDTATTEIYTLSLHDALPIYRGGGELRHGEGHTPACAPGVETHHPDVPRDRGPEVRRGGLVVQRSEEHTSELQSPCNLVCRLLLEKKKKQHRRPALLSSATLV